MYNLINVLKRIRKCTADAEKCELTGMFVLDANLEITKWIDEALNEIGDYDEHA